MRFIPAAFGCVLLASAAAGPARAAPLWGQSGIAPHQAKLDAVGQGRRDFLKWNCYSCHGNNGGGGMGPNIQHADPGDVKEAVLQGAGGGMRSFKKYATAKDAANIAAYLQTIGTKSEPMWFDWWNKNP